MSIVLYHHPFSRAAGVVWMLEEVGVPYELRFVDIMKGGHKAAEIVALNPMGKLPILTDGDAVVTESAAIGLYLADRYSLGRLAPSARRSRARHVPPLVVLRAVRHRARLDGQGRGLGVQGRRRPAGADYDAMLRAMESAVTGRDFVLGDTLLDGRRHLRRHDPLHAHASRCSSRARRSPRTPTASRRGPRCSAPRRATLAVAKEHGLNM